ncbi:hypothetical protein ZWY2020_016134 [Hordeum vulgare]|nr:hypothetical protein ZWY2020_016134 [Hordeum vulgare]
MRSTIASSPLPDHHNRVIWRQSRTRTPVGVWRASPLPNPHRTRTAEAAWPPSHVARAPLQAVPAGTPPDPGARSPDPPPPPEKMSSSRPTPRLWRPCAGTCLHHNHELRRSIDHSLPFFYHSLLVRVRSMGRAMAVGGAGAVDDLKSSWPEVVGWDGFTAMVKIKADRQDVNIEFHTVGDNVAPDEDDHRVRIFLEDHVVAQTPVVG